MAVILYVRLLRMLVEPAQPDDDTGSHVCERDSHDELHGRRDEPALMARHQSIPKELGQRRQHAIDDVAPQERGNER